MISGETAHSPFWNLLNGQPILDVCVDGLRRGQLLWVDPVSSDAIPDRKFVAAFARHGDEGIVTALFDDSS